jgi:hypothetical protein
MEVFFIALAADLEPCIIDPMPHNYEMVLKMTYSDIRLSITKKIPIQYQNDDENGKSESSFGLLSGDELLCFEKLMREKTVVRNAEFQLGTHRITYFFDSTSLVAMPDYIYDAPVPSFPLLVGVDLESMLSVF